MAGLRLATYNVEWFNSLFDDRGRMLADAGPSARYKTSRAEQLGALGIVFSALDADLVLVIEAPDTTTRKGLSRAAMAHRMPRALMAPSAMILMPVRFSKPSVFQNRPWSWPSPQRAAPRCG